MELRSTLSTVLTGVSAIATIIGGIVIMSLMLIAVSERRREIGVRRAVGATRADVMFQFLVEAAVIAVFGGIVGVLLGIGSSIVVIVRQQLPAMIVWEAVAGALVVSATIGLIFGLQPAWKAANVDPIESLRA